MYDRVKLKVKIVSKRNNQFIFQDEDNVKYWWQTKSYFSKLWYIDTDEWVTISGRLFTFDFPNEKNGLKNVRIIK